MATENVTEAASARERQSLELEDAVSELRTIRHALLIGLESFGEVERVIDEVKLAEQLHPGFLRKELRPLHPTGSNDTIGQFAAALRFVDAMELAAEAEHG